MTLIFPWQNALSSSHCQLSSEAWVRLHKGNHKISTLSVNVSLNDWSEAVFDQNPSCIALMIFSHVERPVCQLIEFHKRTSISSFPSRRTVYILPRFENEFPCILGHLEIDRLVLQARKTSGNRKWIKCLGNNSEVLEKYKTELFHQRDCASCCAFTWGEEKWLGSTWPL